MSNCLLLLHLPAVFSGHNSPLVLPEQFWMCIPLSAGNTSQQHFFKEAGRHKQETQSKTPFFHKSKVTPDNIPDSLTTARSCVYSWTFDLFLTERWRSCNDHVKVSMPNTNKTLSVRGFDYNVNSKCNVPFCASWWSQLLKTLKSLWQKWYWNTKGKGNFS